MIVAVGSDAPLFIALASGDNAKYPRAQIYSTAGALVATVNLAYVAASDAFYRAVWNVTAEGVYAVIYTVYTDAGYTTVDSSYARQPDTIETSVATSGGGGGSGSAPGWNQR